MSFSREQIDALKAPLDRGRVATRDQAGQTLSYIESWWAIAEANRIFGHDGWASETVELRCVSERERKIGRQQKDGWGVTYTAKVKVTVLTADGVFPVVREGVGAGSGIDTDLGLAHESAVKEAESDARKRALMTFGNPFGLALYDKSQSNVATLPPPVIDDHQRAALQMLLEQTGVEAPKFFAFYGATNLNDFPAANFEPARKQLAARLQQKAAA